jgi:hypothetical protein
MQGKGRVRSTGLLLGAVLAAATTARAAPARAPEPAPAEDFSADAHLLYLVVGCGAGDLPAKFPVAPREEYCKWLRPKLEAYRKDYLGLAAPFFASHRPKDLPSAVVYPFGGGDLLSALATYPAAREFTTLSLEHAGDPRRLADLDAERLTRSLTELQRRVRGLFAYAESTSENLMQMQRGDLPGQLSFFIVALAAHGMEPSGLRFFHLNPDGSLYYLTKQDVAGEEAKMAKSLNRVWKSPDFSEAFSNAELVYHPVGHPEDVRVHRHIATDLSNNHLRADPSVMHHLDAKGKVATMTKAASYLMWGDGFSDIRDYLLLHMTFMVADSTGPSPASAKKAGIEIETYGRFTGPFLNARKSVAEEYVSLWKEQPYRELPFRYGYPDASHHNHLVLMRPVPAKP